MSSRPRQDGAGLRDRVIVDRTRDPLLFFFFFFFFQRGDLLPAGWLIPADGSRRWSLGRWVIFDKLKGELGKPGAAYTGIARRLWSVARRAVRFSCLAGRDMQKTRWQV